MTEDIKTRKRERENAKPIIFKVNGEEQTAEQGSLTVEAILRNAGSAASIDVAQIDSYFLENITDGHKYEDLDDVVVVKEGDQLLAVHVGRTPVA